MAQFQVKNMQSLLAHIYEYLSLAINTGKNLLCFDLFWKIHELHLYRVHKNATPALCLEWTLQCLTFYLNVNHAIVYTIVSRYV